MFLGRHVDDERDVRAGGHDVIARKRERAQMWTVNAHGFAIQPAADSRRVRTPTPHR